MVIACPGLHYPMLAFNAFSTQRYLTYSKKSGSYLISISKSG